MQTKSNSKDKSAKPSANSGGGNTSSAPKSLVLGTKDSPLTREQYAALSKEARLICSHEGKRGAWWMAKDGAKFQPDGEGIKGRTEGSTNDGSTSRRFVANRLNLGEDAFAALLPRKAEELAETPLAKDNYSARQQKAKRGLSLIRAIMEGVKIELSESPEKVIERTRTPEEKAALFNECGGDFNLYAQKEAATPLIKETIPAIKGGKITLAQLSQGAGFNIPAGAQSDLRRAVNEALNEALSVLTL